MWMPLWMHCVNTKAKKHQCAKVQTSQRQFKEEHCQSLQYMAHVWSNVMCSGLSHLFVFFFWLIYQCFGGILLTMTMTASAYSHCQRQLWLVCLRHLVPKDKRSKSFHNEFWYNLAAISTGLRCEQQCGHSWIDQHKLNASMPLGTNTYKLHSCDTNIDVHCYVLPFLAQTCSCVAFARLHQASEVGMHFSTSGAAFLWASEVQRLHSITTDSTDTCMCFDSASNGADVSHVSGIRMESLHFRHS